MPTGLPQTLPISEGGTGAKNSADARNNLGLEGSATLPVAFTQTFLAETEVAANSVSTQTFPVTGVDPGDVWVVTLGWETNISSGLIVSQAWVSATDTVSISLYNVTGSPIVPVAINFYILAFQIG